MTEKYKLLAQFAKDISYETPNVETFLQAKENIAKYKLFLDINSNPLKNQIIEVNILLSFKESDTNKKASHFEITYTAIARINEKILDKKEMEKIVLCDIPNEVYPKLEDLFINLVKKSGFPDVNIERKIDFNKLYGEKNN